MDYKERARAPVTVAELQEQLRRPKLSGSGNFRPESAPVVLLIAGVQYEVVKAAAIAQPAARGDGYFFLEVRPRVLVP